MLCVFLFLNMQVQRSLSTQCPADAMLLPVQCPPTAASSLPCVSLHHILSTSTVDRPAAQCLKYSARILVIVQAAQMWDGKAAAHRYLHVVQAAVQRGDEHELFRAMFGLAVLQLPRNFTNLCSVSRANCAWDWTLVFSPMLRNQIVGEIGTMLVPF